MLYEVFMQRVMHRTGIEEIAFARQIVDETLLTLGEALNDAHAFILSEKLPSPLNQILTARESGGRILYPDELYREVCHGVGLPISIAMEHAQVVCQVFAEALDTEGLETLELAIAPQWQALFRPRPTYHPPEKPERYERRTLSEGRPGSSRSISEGW